MPPKIDIDQEKLAAFCRKWHIKRLWLFGSVLRDDFRDDSDVDVLYEFEEGKLLGLETFRVEEELANLLGGRRVDFVHFEELIPRIKHHDYFSSELVFNEG